MTNCGDMIVGLTKLPTYSLLEGLKMKHAFVGDKEAILKFVEDNFHKSWVYEVECTLMQETGKCFIVTENGKILGFACYDSAAKGFFGPIGVVPDKQKRNIGKALLIRTLEAMREKGYAYAIIGWVSEEAEQFYRKTVNAEYIPQGSPENSVYSNMIIM